MSKREMDQADLLAKYQAGDGGLTLKTIAQHCGLSYRQIKRKNKLYQKMGAIGLKHGSRGRQGNRGLKPDLVGQILKITGSKYSGYGPTLLSEKLAENHQIKIDHETLRRLMIKEGLIRPRSKRRSHRTWREPKHHAGEMVQVDGSEHVWFGNEYSSLILFIDDATKEMYAQFQPESIKGVATTLRGFIHKYGIPRMLYSDRGKVFKVNNGQNKQAITQFNRMCQELGCEIKWAYSPQAKGRVERAFGTLQDRLVKELEEHNITDMDSANRLLETFMAKMNQKFRAQPRNKEALYKSIEGYDLNSILCYKYQRKLNNDHTIRYQNRWFQLDKKQDTGLSAGNAIDVYIAFDGTISLWRKGIRLSFKEINQAKVVNATKSDDCKLDVGVLDHRSYRWINPDESIDEAGDISKEFKR